MAGSWFRGDRGPGRRWNRTGLACFQRLEARFGPLEDEMTGTKVGIGVATGADRVFITKDPPGGRTRPDGPARHDRAQNSQGKASSWSVWH